MNLYLDDDSAGHRLASLLKKRGHHVTLPSDVVMMGKSDAEHFLFAIQQHLVLVTRNSPDFENLHALVIGSGGGHPGLLVIRQEKDHTKNMKPPSIAAAIDKFQLSGVPIENQAIVLNHWR